jgi:hypothetical protein
VENTDAGEPIGAAVTATDPDNIDDDSDNNNILTYTLSGTDVSSFSIESTATGGQLQTSAPLNHETKDEYTVMVHVTDGEDRNGGPNNAVDDTITVTIKVTDVNEAPAFREGSHTNRFIREGTYPEGTVINDRVEATDEDRPGQTLSYEIVPEIDEFEIDSETGELKTKMALVANHEEHEAGYSYRVVVTVTDDGIIDGAIGTAMSSTIEVIINVTDVNEPPVFTPTPSDDLTINPLSPAAQ